MVFLVLEVWAEIAQHVDELVWRIQDGGTLGDGWKAGCARIVEWGIGMCPNQHGRPRGAGFHIW